MARTGCASAAVTSACGTARNRRRARQGLEAVGRKDLPPIPSQEFTKVLLRTTHGGHFNMAEKRTFLLCVDIAAARAAPSGARISGPIETPEQGLDSSGQPVEDNDACHETFAPSASCGFHLLLDFGNAAFGPRACQPTGQAKDSGTEGGYG